LLKAVPGFQYILNIITVADSADVVADAWQFSFVDADATLRTWTQTQNSRICTSLLYGIVQS